VLGSTEKVRIGTALVEMTEINVGAGAVPIWEDNFEVE